MSTIAYGMSDLAPSADGAVEAGAVSVAQHAGGCGQQHKVQVDDQHRAYVACDECAPVLMGMPGAGWAATPNGVALTPDELGERELAERDGVAMQRIWQKSLMEDFLTRQREDKAGRSPGGAPSLVEQLAALSPEDKAAVAQMLAGGGQETATLVAEVPAPVKRGPGRPRKYPLPAEAPADPAED